MMIIYLALSVTSLFTEDYNKKELAMIAVINIVILFCAISMIYGLITIKII